MLSFDWRIGGEVKNLSFSVLVRLSDGFPTKADIDGVKGKEVER